MIGLSIRLVDISHFTSIRDSVDSTYLGRGILVFPSTSGSTTTTSSSDVGFDVRLGLLFLPPSPRTPPPIAFGTLDIFLEAASNGLLLPELRVLLLLTSPVPFPPFMSLSCNNVFDLSTPLPTLAPQLFNKSPVPRDLGLFCTFKFLLETEPVGLETPPPIALPLLTRLAGLEFTRLGPADGGDLVDDFGGVLFSLRLLFSVLSELPLLGGLERGLVARTGILDRRVVRVSLGCWVKEAGRGTATGCCLSVAAVGGVGTILEGL